MDFQKQNEIYNENKELLAKEKENLEKVRKELERISAEIRVAEERVKNAKGKRQKESAEKKLEGLAKDREKVETELTKARAKVTEYADKIDEIIREVSNDPEIMREVNEKLAKVYDKKIGKLEDEKKKKEEEILKKKVDSLGLGELFEILKKDPETAKKVIEYVEEKIKFKNLNKEKDALMKKKTKDPDDFKRIGEIEAELSKMKDPMKKKKEDISKVIEAQTDLKYLPGKLEDVLETLAAKGLKKGKNNQVDISKSITTAIKRIDEEVKEAEKYKRDLENERKSYEVAKKGVLPKVATDKTKPEEQQPEVKWYQKIGKKISNLFKNRNAKPEEHTPPEGTTPPAKIGKEIKKTELYQKGAKRKNEAQETRREKFLKSLEAEQRAEDAAARAKAEAERLAEEYKKAQEAREAAE